MPAGVAADPGRAGRSPRAGSRRTARRPSGLLGTARSRGCSPAAGVLPASGCPAEGQHRYRSRTATSAPSRPATPIWRRSTPGCGQSPTVHRAQDESGSGLLAARRSEGEAIRSRRRRPGRGGRRPEAGGIAGCADRAARCARDASTASIAAPPHGLRRPRARPRRVAPDRAGQAAQAHRRARYGLDCRADPPPANMPRVGRSRRSAGAAPPPPSIARIGSLHSTEFRILARPGYMAARNIAPIARRMLATR